MNEGKNTQFVTVQELRVGMHVHLDLGWLDHPFALNSFRIGSADQIETLRSLGVLQVRWDPERSDPAVLAALNPPPKPVYQMTPAEVAEAEQRRRRREEQAAQNASQGPCDRQ